MPWKIRVGNRHCLHLSFCVNCKSTQIADKYHAFSLHIELRIITPTTANCPFLLDFNHCLTERTWLVSHQSASVLEVVCWLSLFTMALVKLPLLLLLWMSIIVMTVISLHHTNVPKATTWSICATLAWHPTRLVEVLLIKYVLVAQIGYS